MKIKFDIAESGRPKSPSMLCHNDGKDKDKNVANLGFSHLTEEINKN